MTNTATIMIGTQAALIDVAEANAESFAKDMQRIADDMEAVITYEISNKWRGTFAAGILVPQQ